MYYLEKNVVLKKNNLVQFSTDLVVLWKCMSYCSNISIMFELYVNWYLD